MVTAKTKKRRTLIQKAIENKERTKSSVEQCLVDMRKVMMEYQNNETTKKKEEAEADVR